MAQEGIRPLTGPRQHRLLPLVLPMVEDVRLGHMVGGVQVGLHVEQVLGVAQMRPQVLRHRVERLEDPREQDRKSTRLNSSHLVISYAVFCLKKKKKKA